MSNRPRGRTALAMGAALAAAAGLTLYLATRGPSLPGPGDDVYEETTRAFYHGLAALEVGLLDDARQQFTRATELIDAEPASWVNLGVTQLRLGELDAAAAPVERALALAPGNSDVVLVAGRMEIARGRLDEGIAYLERAAALDPGALRPRYALAEEVARSGAAGADDRAQALFDELAQLAPGNLAVLVERARVAARRGDAERLRDSVQRLAAQSAPWPPIVSEQLTALQDAVNAGSFADAARLTAPLRNVLASVPTFRQHLAEVQTATELIAEPVTRFVALEPASATPSPADGTLSYVEERSGGDVAVLPEVLLAFPASMEGAPPVVFAADRQEVYRANGTGSWPLMPTQSPASASALLALDWNNDFRTDVFAAGAGAVRLLVQNEDGSFTEAGAQWPAEIATPGCCTGAWAADVEMDGDLDIVVAMEMAAPLVLRNNANGTSSVATPFPGLASTRGFAWADLDGDADPDAVFLNASGGIQAFANRQAGDFVPMEALSPPDGNTALTVADLDADGAFDLVVLGQDGGVRRGSRSGGAWEFTEIARWDGLRALEPGHHRLLAADLDNNGALDLLAAGGGESRIWLSGEDYEYAAADDQRIAQLEVFAVLHADGDGRLDLVTLADGLLAFQYGRGDAPYHWKIVRARAQLNAGDQRINSFGVGGEVQVRSGLLVQKQLLAGGPVHVGLGSQSAIDVARIVWPNGVAQAEFGIGVDDAIVAEQRLKGSCPWVFVWDGTRMRFVTDFLWRSPLGLRINALDTAGVSQTEDWVRISGEHLVPHDGSYDVRITAELWETHFFDHVSLLVVDHPADTEVFVDERFSAAAPPRLEVTTVAGLRPLARARDAQGADVTELLAQVDGRYVASFERGRYQGIADDHFVELELGEGAGAGTLLIATGWIYPTDSSINVAIAQGGIEPHGLALEAQRADGRWTTVHADLGFPAGKNKTVLIDLGGIGDARRLRLRTNLEISWDAMALADVSDERLATARLGAAAADLVYRGFSTTTSPRGAAPETPDYGRISNTRQRWRDLEGFHTRFGDVKELLASVDDRYVIMNAGDEMRLLFPEQPPPGPGWRRDFVLIGDGWEKDGDYNTGFSQTVLPLPSHDNPAYEAASLPLSLESDPVYQRHREDWLHYHTRYVAPDRFVSGLRRH